MFCERQHFHFASSISMGLEEPMTNINSDLQLKFVAMTVTSYSQNCLVTNKSWKDPHLSLYEIEPSNCIVLCTECGAPFKTWKVPNLHHRGHTAWLPFTKEIANNARRNQTNNKKLCSISTSLKVIASGNVICLQIRCSKQI